MTTRYFNVFGPRQDPGSPYSGVISLFTTALLDGRRPTIYGDGEQTRDFTYVANVVDGVLRACEAPKAAGEVINVATGGRISLNELLRGMNRIVGTKLQPIYKSRRAGDVRDSQADISKATAAARLRADRGARGRPAAARSTGAVARQRKSPCAACRATCGVTFDRLPAHPTRPSAATSPFSFSARSYSSYVIERAWRCAC